MFTFSPSDLALWERRLSGATGVCFPRVVIFPSSEPPDPNALSYLPETGHLVPLFFLPIVSSM